MIKHAYVLSPEGGTVDSLHVATAAKPEPFIAMLQGKNLGKQLDPAALGLLRFIPLPNQPGQVQNYQYTTSTSSNSNYLSTRMNRTLNRKNRLEGSFSVLIGRHGPMNPAGMVRCNMPT